MNAGLPLWRWGRYAFALGVLGAAVATAAEPAAGPCLIPGRAYSHLVKPLPEGLDRADFRLWIPDSIGADGTVHGVIAAANYHVGRIIFTDCRWRQFAEKHHLAILLHHVTRPVKEADLAQDRAGLDAVLEALRHFAGDSGHPELARAGLIFTGFSQSGEQASAFARFAPQRAIAVISYHSAGPDAHEPGCEGRGCMVPQLYLMAGSERFEPAKPGKVHAFVLKARAGGALWAGCYEAQVPHHQLGRPDFVFAWTEAVLDARVPENIPKDGPCRLVPLAEKDGFLGVLKLEGDGRDCDVAAEVCPWTAFSGNRAEADWLPNEAVAQAWREYCLRESARDQQQRPLGRR